MRSDALLAQVVRHPDDAALCRVWADSLIEEGDPRGELAMLQLAEEEGHLDDAGAQRIRELQSMHEKQWLGDLAEVTQSAVFKRGLPTELCLTALDVSTVAKIRALGVSSVVLPKSRLVAPGVVAHLLAEPLRGLKGVSRELLDDLLLLNPVGLVELGVAGAAIDEMSLERFEGALPDLRELHIDGGSVVLAHLIWTSALVHRLDTWTHAVGPFSLTWTGRWVEVHVERDELPMLRLEAELRAAPEIERISVTPAHHATAITDLARRFGARLL